MNKDKDDKNFLSRREALKRIGVATLGFSALSLLGNDVIALNNPSKNNFPNDDPAPISGGATKETLSELYKKKKEDLPESVVFKNVNVITMIDNAILENQVVIIKNGIIDQIGNADEVKYSPGSKMQEIDAKGKYLLPGLHDMHSHFYNKDDMMLFIVNGVTTTRCMNGTESFLDWRKERNNETILGPKLYVTSPTLIGDEYKSSIVISDDVDDSGFDYINSPEQAKEAVTYYKLKGYDFIKVFDPFDAALYKIVAKEAETSLQKLVGHVPKGTDPIVSKQYTIEHFCNEYLRLEKNFEKIAKEGVWVCPTLSVYVIRGKKTNENDPNLLYASKKLKKEWEKWPSVYMANSEKQLARIKDFYKLGGKIIAGTDCRVQYTMPGFSMHSELELYVKYGIPAFDALKTATVNAAQCLEVSDKVGTIEKGKIGDCILLDANPLANISNIRKIAGVITTGQWIDKKEIEQILLKLYNARH